MDTLAILGVGLMGGSFGLAARARALADEVVGWDLDPGTLERALGRGAITRAAESPAAAARQADLVVLATPVRTLAGVFETIAPVLRPGSLVTDLGSTKAGVVEAITPAVPEGVGFVGGHPMAGSEKEGVDAARADLYDGCLWILTPTEATATGDFGRLMRFLAGLGARVVSLDPVRHDEAMALTSHLPQLLSSVLMGFAADVAAAGEGLPLLTAGGFRDMTRIAASSPDMWVGIVQENRSAVAGLVRRFLASLQEAAEALEQGDWDRLRRTLEQARRARHDLPGKPGRASTELVELAVAVPDRRGVLAEVTTTLTRAGVNIEDLNIVHSPEGARGVVHLLVDPASAAVAVSCLRERGYEAEPV